MTESLTQTCEKLDLVALLLHGSRVSGFARSDSDYDIAYLSRHGDDTRPIESALLPALAHALKCDERQVDLQNLRTAPPHFRTRVLHYGRLLYLGDSTELARFHAVSLSMDRDTRIFTQPFREALRRRIREGSFASG